MKGKSLYLPFGHAFEGVGSENELQTTTKIHFEYESRCGRHLAKMRRRALLTSGKSMVRQIVLFTWRMYEISTNSTWRSSWLIEIMTIVHALRVNQQQKRKYWTCLLKLTEFRSAWYYFLLDSALGNLNIFINSSWRRRILRKATWKEWKFAASVERRWRSR